MTWLAKELDRAAKALEARKPTQERPLRILESIKTLRSHHEALAVVGQPVVGDALRALSFGLEEKARRIVVAAMDPLPPWIPKKDRGKGTKEDPFDLGEALARDGAVGTAVSGKKAQETWEAFRAAAAEVGPEELKEVMGFVV